MKKDEMLAKKVAQGVVDFLRKSRKEESLDLVIEFLQKERKSSSAIVYTPITLKASEKKKMMKTVSELANETPETFTFKIDPTLIDGIKIFYKDKLWDFSILNQLKSVLDE